MTPAKRKPYIDAIFEEMYDRHIQSMRGSALRLTGNPEDASDLLQEAAVRAYQGFSSFRTGTNFRAWMNKILVNTHINHVRKRQKSPDTVDYDSMREETDKYFIDRAASCHDKSTISNYNAGALLSQLPDRFRIPVILVDIEGMSYKDISNIMEIPLGTVRSRVFRGRKRLRNLVRNNGHIPRSDLGDYNPDSLEVDFVSLHG